MKVKDITPIHMEKYVNIKTQELSPNTVIKHLHNISKCLDTAIRQNIITFNPVKRIDWPQKVRYTGAKCLNPLQIEKLLATIKGDMLETIILFGLFYGFRRSDEYVKLMLRFLNIIHQEDNSINIDTQNELVP